MNSRKAFLLKFLVFLFALNSISLYLYFSSHPDYFRPKSQTENRHFVTETRKHPTENRQYHPVPVSFHRKPWPILPSYLPWSLNPNVSAKSCEGYFGNGFNRRIDLLRSPPDIPRRSPSYAGTGTGGGGGGWFRCFYSETLESSICEGGSVQMNPEKIRMSIGGERLDSVIGREEEDELPSFDLGAFKIEVDGRLDQGGSGRKLVNGEFLDRFVPVGAIQRHTMRGLLDSIQLVGPDEFKCSQWVEEPTLLVTRFEYANLFHTITDWYSAYVASRVTGLPNRPHLIFVDGHCKVYVLNLA
ncbi:hypothetical protein HHK36_005756 [Tetracentron sinense]|uniref:Uncharacterized protein n=1 Tax=Tetracentron sinense TaxID=13715 RepID=A0A834ZNW7_TETSI|nr:hypothetical protein HHK36_005756 [Tetracentron sinense]